MFIRKSVFGLKGPLSGGNSRKDRYVTRMAVKNRTATSHALSKKKMESLGGQNVYTNCPMMVATAWTVGRSCLVFWTEDLPYCLLGFKLLMPLKPRNVVGDDER
ncbi:hypothetical protein NPIL_196191 [Nephila pilipes]|uniref:Uncharacterized protein n=1 Tax=Nephila pilipes TaxID=299642 RepID=A0A8X6U0S9_NEPPI|nr:hypothetical protein NPIL_196191 [Nephila pilipes]